MIHRYILGLPVGRQLLGNHAMVYRNGTYVFYSKL
jgi:hypothetical protein